MIIATALLFLVLWVLGLLTAHTLGGFLPALPIIGALLLCVRIVQGKSLRD